MSAAAPDNDSMDAYDRVVVRVGSGAQAATVATLWEMGILGLELVDEPGGEVRILAYFPHRRTPATEVMLLGLTPHGASLETIGEVLDRDWMASYREASRPFAVGRDLWIDPREPGAAAVVVPAGRTLLRLPARRAFGIGTHESTRLAIELLESEAVGGRRCLDLGCGSGVLSLLLRRQGARWVLGIDLDPIAALQAGQNASLNSLAPTLAAATIESLSPAAQFDLCVANMLPQYLLPQLAAIAALVPDGVLILSGALERQDGEVSRQLENAGFRVAERRRDGEWIGYRTVREAQ